MRQPFHPLCARLAADFRCLASGFLALAAAIPAQAQIYRCTEAGGKVSYQAQACSPSQAASRVSLPGAAAPAAPAVAAMPAPPAREAIPSAAQAVSQRRVFGAAAFQAYQAERAIGLRVFRERCRSAGKSAYAAVRALEGLRLDTVPGESRVGDPNWLLAGMPAERLGERFIASFLDFDFHELDLAPDFGEGDGSVRMTGFQYVDVRGTDGRYRRYRLAQPSDPSKGMTSEPIENEKVARYAVSLEPLGTAEDREHWVAGTRILVTDTQTQRIIGESRSYSYALPPEIPGSDMNARHWQHRQSCPEYLDIRNAMTRTSLIGIADPAYRTAMPRSR